MPKIFISIALALMLGTALLGFLAKGKVDRMRLGYQAAKLDQQKAQADFQVARNELKQAAEDAALTNEKAKETAQALETKTAELTAKNQQLVDAQGEKDVIAAELAKAKEWIAAHAVDPTPPSDSKREFAYMTEELQKAQAEVAETKKIVEIQAAQIKSTESKNAELQTKLSKVGNPYATAGLQGKVLAVNAGWNFVVLSVGDKQGVAIDAPLLVVRGNTPIARLRITSVEPTTSIADVIPGSVGRGVTVQPGDAVIFQGRTSKNPPVDADRADAAVFKPLL